MAVLIQIARGLARAAVHYPTARRQAKAMQAQYASREVSGPLVSGPLRIFLSALGVLMILSALTLIGLLMVMGPDDLADATGNRCARGSLLRGAGKCSVSDIWQMIVTPIIFVVLGSVLLICTRRDGGRALPSASGPASGSR